MKLLFVSYGYICNSKIKWGNGNGKIGLCQLELFNLCLFSERAYYMIGN